MNSFRLSATSGRPSVAPLRNPPIILPKKVPKASPSLLKVVTNLFNADSSTKWLTNAPTPKMTADTIPSTPISFNAPEAAAPAIGPTLLSITQDVESANNRADKETTASRGTFIIPF